MLDSLRIAAREANVVCPVAGKALGRSQVERGGVGQSLPRIRAEVEQIHVVARRRLIAFKCRLALAPIAIQVRNHIRIKKLVLNGGVVIGGRRLRLGPCCTVERDGRDLERCYFLGA